MRLHKPKITFNHSAVLFLFLALSFIFDFIDKLDIYNNLHFIKFNRILKVVFSIYALGVCLFHFKFFYKKIKFVFISLLILSLVFLLKGENYNFYKMEFMRYAILFISFPVLYYVVSFSNSKTIIILYKLLKYIVIINAILILAGLIFDIQSFKTYRVNRFGFNGMLISQGFAPFFYMSASILFWYFKDKTLLVITILIALLSGVKGVYLAEFIAFTLIVLFDNRLSKAFKIKALIGIFIGFISITLVILNLSPFKEIFKTNGLLTIIFSFRIENLKLLFSAINSENFNFFIGAKDLETVRLELQLVDIFIYFGSIGLLVYGYYIFKLYKIIKHNYLAIILLVTALTTSMFSGNLFYIPLSSILCTLTLLCLNEDTLKIKESAQ